MTTAAELLASAEMLAAAADLTEAARPLEPADGIAPPHLLAHMLGARHAGAWGSSAAILAGRLEILQAAAEVRGGGLRRRPLETPQYGRALDAIAAAAPTNGPGTIAVARALAASVRLEALTLSPGDAERRAAYALRLLEEPRPVRAAALRSLLADAEAEAEDRREGAKISAALAAVRSARDGLAAPDCR